MDKDDLALSLSAVSGDIEGLAMQTDDGKLRLRRRTEADATSPVVSASNGAHFAALGCQRIVELVHNNPPNKTEAMDRAALPILAAACTSFRYKPHVQAHACRAVRSICFRNDEAREKATVAIREMVAALVEAADVLEYHRTPADARSNPELQTVDPAFSLMLAEEALNALAAVCNRHGELAMVEVSSFPLSNQTGCAEANTLFAIEQGARDAVVRVEITLNDIRWPLSSSSTGASPTADGLLSPLLVAPASLAPATVLVRANFLKALLAE